MATSYKLMMISYSADPSSDDVALIIGVFPANVDPTQRNADGSLVNQPIDSLRVAGSLSTGPAAWQAGAVEAFDAWCTHRALVASAQVELAAQATTVLNVTDPTGS